MSAPVARQCATNIVRTYYGYCPEKFVPSCRDSCDQSKRLPDFFWTGSQDRIDTTLSFNYQCMIVQGWHTTLFFLNSCLTVERDHVRSLHAPSPTLADEFNTLFVLHVSSPTHRRSSHCHTNYLFPHSSSGSPSRCTTRIDQAYGSTRRTSRLGPSQVGIGIDHFYVRKDFYFAFCTLSFVSFCFRPPALYSGIPSLTLAHLPFRTLHLLHPCYLYIHPSALDRISVNLSLFRALHPLAIVAVRACRQQARLYIWFPFFPP